MSSLGQRSTHVIVVSLCVKKLLIFRGIDRNPDAIDDRFVNIIADQVDFVFISEYLMENGAEAIVPATTYSSTYNYSRPYSTKYHIVWYSSLSSSSSFLSNTTQSNTPALVGDVDGRLRC